jgi:hypothetical protein
MDNKTTDKANQLKTKENLIVVSRSRVTIISPFTIYDSNSMTLRDPGRRGSYHYQHQLHYPLSISGCHLVTSHESFFQKQNRGQQAEDEMTKSG